MRPQPYLKNQRQLRKIGSGRDAPPGEETSTGCPVPNSLASTHTSNTMQNEHVISEIYIKHTYISIHAITISE